MRRLIRSNSLRLVVLAWFACWLLMVMPGHKRGIVTLPGSKASTHQAVDDCCKPKPSCCDTSGAGTDHCEPDGPAPPSDPARHCAICFLKAQLTDPPPLVFYTPYLGELDELTFLIESSITDSQAAPQLLRGRAPPRA